jgi:hypothetical protein
VLLSPPPSQSQVRRNIRLKVKGLNGGTFKIRSQSHSGSLLLAPFPFSRFTNAEIVDLFHPFRVRLGFNEIQRDQIIKSFRSMQRNQFDSLVHQIIDKSQHDSFDIVTVVPLEQGRHSFSLK